MTSKANVILSDAEKKHILQQEILLQSGGLVSILGSTSDASLMALELLVKVSSSVTQAESLADVKAAFVPVQDMLASFHDELERGETRLPHHVKPSGAALADIIARARLAADIISENHE